MNFPTNIYLFVNDCYSRVVDGQDIDIQQSFLKHVDNNEEAAKQYESCLVKVEEALKEDSKPEMLRMDTFAKSVSKSSSLTKDNA